MVEKLEERKKVFVKTYGCQMNVYDSNRMEDALEQDGYERTNDMEDADLVLLNTCHIREKAAEKVYSEVGRIRKIKEKRADTNRPMTIGVTGCVAQAEGSEIMKRAKAVDLVAGPQTYHRIADIVNRAEQGERPVETEFEIEEKFAKLPHATAKQVQARGVASFLTVQEGCDKFCTFCVVPYTRGAEVLEKKGRREGQLIGRSPWLQSVIVDDSLGNPGDIVHVEITEAAPNSLNAIKAQKEL